MSSGDGRSGSGKKKKFIPVPLSGISCCECRLVAFFFFNFGTCMRAFYTATGFHLAPRGGEKKPAVVVATKQQASAAVTAATVPAFVTDPKDPRLMMLSAFNRLGEGTHPFNLFVKLTPRRYTLEEITRALRDLERDKLVRFDNKKMGFIWVSEVSAAHTMSFHLSEKREKLVSK